MNKRMKRKRAAMRVGEADDGNLVISFTPVTKQFGTYECITVPLSETIIRNKIYRVVLDGTTIAGTRFLVLVGAKNNKITYYPDGQDGEIEKTWTSSNSGDNPTANAYIYCRPVSGTATVQSATIRNIKVYKEGWE